MKKFLFAIAIVLTFSLFPVYSQGALRSLCLAAMDNNSDIQAAENNWKNAEISRKSAGGAFVPSVSISSSAILPNEYEWKTCPDGFSSQILELQSKKWSYQQDLMSVLQDRESYIQSLEVLCGMSISADDIDGKFFVDDVSAEDFCIFVNELCGGKVDPCEKALLANIQTLTTSVTSARQSAAPVVNFSVTPA
ncbi:MAG: hypothetical protein K5681_02640 [Treponema sp.]|nr:hypothetical protein [Treponema sp.]